MRPAFHPANSIRQSMSWVHTWFGLVFCWIMYFMFVTGTLGYFDNEIDQWMKPEVPVNENIPLIDSVQAGENYLIEHAQGADSWQIWPVRERNNTLLYVSWRGPDGRDHADIDAATGELVDTHIRDTGGGQTLYRMHYILHYFDRDIAFKIIGVITVMMFIGVLSGIVIHRKIFKDFFTFRPQKAGSKWLDLHNLASVSTLPFQLMISYSGLLFAVTTFLPLIAIGGLGFNEEVIREEVPKIFNRIEIPRSGSDAPLVPMTRIVEQLEDIDPNHVRNINVYAPGDRNALVVVTLADSISTRSADVIHFDGVTGEWIKRESRASNTAIVFYAVLTGLHEGLFAGPLLRWLYFLSGVLGSVMIATGAIYWLEKRRKKYQKRVVPSGFKLVENLNIGTIVGLITAIGAYFWANRLLPLDVSHRADWEVHCMFLVWLVCLIHPFIRRNKMRAWAEQCWLAAAVYLPLPLLNYLTTGQSILHYFQDNNRVLFGFELVVLTVGILMMYAAKTIQAKEVAS